MCKEGDNFVGFKVTSLCGVCVICDWLHSEILSGLTEDSM